jgi:hypothetical protein
VFLILIFGSSLPFFTAQNYTIKKTLPKLIIAVILTQFTLPITGIVIDFFNLLGYAIPNVILALGRVPEAITGTGNAAARVGAGVGSTIGIGLGTVAGVAGAGALVLSGFGWIFIVFFLLAAIIAVIVGFVYMVLRYFLIYVMIIIAPLAFVAWVIPGTEKFFKQWWTDFIRLNAMFVTIMALLSSSVVIASALSAQPGSDLGFLPALMPLIALFLIPKTLKATTKGLSALSGAALGAAGVATGKVTGAAKSKGKEVSKAQFQEKRSEAAAEAFGKNTRFGRTQAALLQGKLPTAKGQFQAGQKASAFNAEQRKQATESLEFLGSTKDFGTYQSELRKVASGQGSSVLKANKGDRNVQIAAGNLLAQQGDVAHLRAMASGGQVTNLSTGAIEGDYSGSKIEPNDLAEMIKPSYGDIKSAAPDVASGGSMSAYYNIGTNGITGLDASSIAAYSEHLRTHTPKDANEAAALADAKKNFNARIQELSTSDKKELLKADQITQLNAYSASAGLTVKFD